MFAFCIRRLHRTVSHNLQHAEMILDGILEQLTNKIQLLFTEMVAIDESNKSQNNIETKQYIATYSNSLYSLTLKCGL